MILTDTLKEQFQLYMSTKLLKYAIDILQLVQFAETQELPKKGGAKRMRFFRPMIADTSNIVALAEGVPINTFGTYKYDTVDFDLVQYGEAARLSDIVQATELWDNSKNLVRKFGEDAALWADTLVRDSIVQPTTGLQARYTGGATTYSALSALSASAGALTPFDLLDAITQLRTNKAPTINGGYVAVAAPEGIRDIQTKQYSDVKELYNGETGSMYGIGRTWGTNPMRETSGGTAGVFDANGAVLSTIVTGMGSYACPRLSGNKPESPTVMVVDKADSLNPLAQFITIGWKIFFTAGVLNSKFGLVLRHKSPFVAAS